MRAHYRETTGDRTGATGASGTATLGSCRPPWRQGLGRRAHSEPNDCCAPRAPSGAERGWLAAGLAVVVGLTLADLALGNKMTLGGASVLSPFLASVGARPRVVCLVGGVALMAGTGLAVLDGIGLHEIVTHVSVLAIGTAVACEAARVHVAPGAPPGRPYEHRRGSTAGHRPRAGTGSARWSALATCYREFSVDAAAVGGDFYEALDTPYGTRLMIGDVPRSWVAQRWAGCLHVGGVRSFGLHRAGLGEDCSRARPTRRPLCRRCREQRS